MIASADRPIKTFLLIFFGLTSTPGVNASGINEDPPPVLLLGGGSGVIILLGGKLYGFVTTTTVSLGFTFELPVVIGVLAPCGRGLIKT